MLFTMQTIDEISIKSVLKRTLSKIQYLYWRRIKFKFAEITMCQTSLFFGESYVNGIHLVNEINY